MRGEVTPCAILTKCGMLKDIGDVIMYAIFGDYQLTVGTNLIHDFTAVTFSVKLAFFREKRPFPCFRKIP